MLLLLLRKVSAAIDISNLSHHVTDDEQFLRHPHSTSVSAGTTTEPVRESTTELGVERAVENEVESKVGEL